LVGEAPRIDFAFVDAEHQGDPTMSYFATMIPHLSPGAVVVFDDVTWGEEMKAAWRAIRRHSRLAVAVGLGRMGAVVVGSG
jgi:predicted O-methyltransferase YrrM